MGYGESAAIPTMCAVVGDGAWLAPRLCGVLRFGPMAGPRVAVLALICLCVGLVRPVQAQDARPRHLGVEIGLFGGVFMPDEHHEFYDPNAGPQEPLAEVSPDVGIRFGFYPVSFLGIEGEGSSSFTEASGGGTANLYSVRGSLVLQAPLRVAPFVMGGIGNTWLRSEQTTLGRDRDRVWHGAAGLKIFVNRTLELRLEGRVYYTNQERDEMDPTDDNGMVTHFGALAGVSWVFGGSRRRELDINPDPDADGFVVPEDRCPEQRGVEPDGCPGKDADEDGLADASDRCPTEGETINGHDDTDGCPDELPDGDGDQVRGEADRCPSEAEDTDGFEDSDGCPDVDNDKDGLVDASDSCPEQSGAPENRGCPDSDQDSDGVVDRLDNCPDQPGRADFQGCRTKQLISITPSQLKVFQNVQFSSARATIARKSRRLLANVAEVIRAHPEFHRIRVEGHTDDRGGTDINKALSQQRAQAVVDFLVSLGVEADRLEAIGYGEERPVSSNRSASGRRKNRRVEFNLEDIRPPGTRPAGTAPATPPSPKKDGAKPGDPAAKPGDAPADPAAKPRDNAAPAAPAAKPPAKPPANTKDGT